MLYVTTCDILICGTFFLFYLRYHYPPVLKKNRCKEKCVPDFINKLDLNSRFLEIYEIGHKYVATGRTEKKYTLLNDDLSYNNSYCDYLTCEGRKDDAILLSKANYGRSYLSEDRKLMANVVFMSGTIYESDPQILVYKL